MQLTTQLGYSQERQLLRAIRRSSTAARFLWVAQAIWPLHRLALRQQ